MKKIIGLSAIGFLALSLTSAVFAAEDIYPIRDNPEFDTYAGTEDFDQWREEMLENRPEDCLLEEGAERGYQFKAENEGERPGQGMRRGNGLGNGQGNGYGQSTTDTTN